MSNKRNKMDTAENLNWQGPYLLRDWLRTILDGLEKEVDAYYPPEKPGVYVLTLQQWTGQPKPEDGSLYIGCSDNLLGRIHDLLSPAWPMNRFLPGAI